MGAVALFGSLKSAFAFVGLGSVKSYKPLLFARESA